MLDRKRISFRHPPDVEDASRMGKGAYHGTWKIFVVILCLMLMGGCSDESQYKVLRFFFDGVPKPGEQIQKNKQKKTQHQKNNAGESATTPAFFLHDPYKNRKCRACHSMGGFFQPRITDKLLCRRCHESYYKPKTDDWVHGPVLFNQCALCHLPHKARHAKLLRQAQPRLCLQCHNKNFFQEDPFHRHLKKLRCSNCHEPHAAGNRLLLVDSNTYKRRKTNPTKMFKHPPWKRTDCTRCHLVEQSYKLTDHVDKACLVCHQKWTVPPTGGQLHPPVQNGQCTRCHTPHRSPRKHLVKPNAEKLCLSCHPPQTWRSDRHPKVKRVDCLICHQGHHLDRPHLLRPYLIPEKNHKPSKPSSPPTLQSTTTPPGNQRKSQPGKKTAETPSALHRAIQPEVIR